MKASCSPGQTVTGKFYCDFLRWMMENNRRNFPESWRNKSYNRTPCNMTTIRLTRRSLCGSCWLLRTGQSFPPSLLSEPRHLWIFSIPRDNINAKFETFWRYWDNHEQIAGLDEDTDTKFLPAVLLILEIPLESLYHSRCGPLQRGWKRIEILLGG
jgi:hypothetical protein